MYISFKKKVTMGNNSTIVFIKYKDITIYGLVPITEPSKAISKKLHFFSS